MTFRIRSLAILLLVLAPAALHAQGISNVTITAPDLILVSGERIQLEAVARDGQGNPRDNDRFIFRSSNANVASADPSGIVTAANPGIASVTANVQGTNATSAGVLLQVIPLRIDIAGAASEIKVGEARQFTAAAIDINGQPIPGVVFRWQVTGANGFNTRAATIDSNGLLKSNGIGLMTIRAQIEYPGRSAAHIPMFEGLMQVPVTARREFKLTRLLANTTMDRGLGLRPAYNSEPGINDSGQIAFTASLDGLGSALMFYDGGKFNMLASAGTPGPLGGYIWHFEGPPAINNRGDVLVRVGTSFGWGLLRATQSSGLTFILENGAAEGVGRMNFFRPGRYSINDRGDMVFLGDVLRTGTTVSKTGLFLLNDTSFRYIWSAADPLPGFPADFAFDNSMFGVDGNGVVYFRVTSGSNSAIFRADGLSEPVKIAGTGANIGTGSSTVQLRDVQNLAVSPNGTVAFSVTANGGSGIVAGIVRLRSGEKNLEFLLQRSVGLVLSVNDAGETLYSGDPGRDPWWGIYTWKDATLQFLRFSYNSDFPLPGGENPTWARTGKITARGEIYVSLDSSESHLLMSRIDGPPRTLWKAGTVLNPKANLNFQGIVPGAQVGPLHVFGGGSNASIMEVGTAGMRTIWVPGDRLVQGVNGTTFNYAAKNPAGDLYLTFGDGIIRFSNGRADAVARFPVDDRDKVTLRGPSGFYDGNNALSVNSAGAFVFNARTDRENRLELYTGGVITPIVILGGSSQTASPGGGKFSGLANTALRQNSVLIDERGRVMINAQVSGGPSGLFLNQNGQWKSAALLRTTSIAGATPSNFRAMRVAGETFYAMFDLSNGDTMIAQYDGQTWTPLVRKSDVLPDGTGLNNFQNAFAVNRRGEIVYSAGANGEKLILRTADGVYHLIYSEMTPTDDGDRLPSQTFEFDIRDDGLIYFTGFDSTDRSVVYKAERIP